MLQTYNNQTISLQILSDIIKSNIKSNIHKKDELSVKYPNKEKNVKEQNKELNQTNDKENSSFDQTTESQSLSESLSQGSNSKAKSITQINILNQNKNEEKMKPEREYQTDIYMSLIEEENQNTFTKFHDYMAYQKELNVHIRAMIVDFNLQLSKMMNLKDKTFYLSIQIMDRFFSVESINQYYFKLLGITCLYVSAKLEELFYPPISDFIYVANCAEIYNEDQVKKLEKLVLDRINFNVLPLYSFCFFEILAMNFNLNKYYKSMGQFLLEICLYEYSFLAFKSSTLAEAVILFILKIMKKDDFYDYISNTNLSDFIPGFSHSNQHCKEINDCTFIIQTLINNIDSSIFLNVLDKYSKTKNEFIKEILKFTLI